ncbi:hypothetical protein EDD22DRAFT_953321 [Suillus occidentalis]|nr:hypothetical protein EDD22DRAFT_953321 [Suillus occidentalis]
MATCSSPPTYGHISTSVSPAQSRQSMLSSIKQIRIKPSVDAPALDDTIPTASSSQDSVLSRVRDLVSAPEFTPSSAAKIVDACAAALPNEEFSEEFSDLLQTANIEDYTALYWAIVNDRLEAFSALAGAISQFSSNCYSDLRLACMITNDQTLFAQLNLGNLNGKCIIKPKDEPLTRSMGCSPDVIEVHEGGTTKLRGKRGDFQFVGSFRIKMFQKRLRSTG